jgi:hypothetical protein
MQGRSLNVRHLLPHTVNENASADLGRVTLYVADRLQQLFRLLDVDRSGWSGAGYLDDHFAILGANEMRHFRRL